MDKVIDIGDTPIECVYDLASILGLVNDGIRFDRESEFGVVFQGLVNSLYQSLPDTVLISFTP